MCNRVFLGLMFDVCHCFVACEGYKLSIIGTKQCLQNSYSMCSFILYAVFIFYVQSHSAVFASVNAPAYALRSVKNLDFATVRTKLPTVLDGFATKKYWFPAAIWTIRSMSA